MRRLILTAFSFFFLQQSLIAQLGVGTNTPDSSAMLDVFSNSKGFLPPRIALTAINLTDPIANPAVGLLIYNTATSGADSVKVLPGYYYWDGTKWFAISKKGEARGEMLFWTGEKWTTIPVGAEGSVLTLCKGIPKWGALYGFHCYQ